ncbi:transposase family protein [Nocardia abscessus]|uniref:transposase family protein n=2 Tax=Nocardia TaxID=1817 RepID=UPI0024557122|nr:transposase family protein [Nocardia abscessus]
MLRVLFPHLDRMVIGAVRVADSTVRIDAATREEPAACPSCSTPSQRVHSRYRRRLADTAITGREVVIVLRVRRLFCDNANCGRRTSLNRYPDSPPATGGGRCFCSGCCPRSPSPWVAAPEHG